ncbi:MAG: chemotaxis protein CheW [Lachnospiraceae bacterium]|nr:chemotaxis protein CheW [Lachnospiraceae bacterium]
MNEIREQYETTQFIVVKYGDEQFGVDIKYVDNIVRMQRITRVPKVQSYIKGVINLRGEVIPVLSLRLKMGLEEDVITKATRIIIIKLESNECIGVLVDEVKEVVTLENAAIEKVGYDSKDPRANFVFGVGKEKDGLISLLDISGTFAEKEKEA